MGLCVVTAWVALTSATPVAVASGAVLALVPVVEWVMDTAEPGWGAWFAGISFTTALTIFVRRLRVTMTQLRAAQDELAERSRAEERNRIAAEVHDVIGHALTVSLLHISGARLALDEDPQEARRSLLEAERLTRDSLEEVRATVGLMRTDSPDRRAPLPDAGDLPALVESFRRAGSDVELVVDEHLDALGATRGLAAYRIVQEALTNALRYGSDRTARLRVVATSAEVSIEASNPSSGTGGSGAGLGLVGVSERVALLGGRLTHGVRDGRFELHARLPLVTP
jgi:signal transduction histidine kinase